MNIICFFLSQLTSILLPTHPEFNCSINYLSIVCAEMNLLDQVSIVSFLLRKKLYADKELRPCNPEEGAKQWIIDTFSTSSSDVQESVLSILTLEPWFNSCSQTGSAVTCDVNCSMKK